MQKISPFLWFDTQAEEAAKFYTSIFKNSKISRVARFPEGSPGPVGGVMTVSFELNEQQFVALNGGPHYTFNNAVSFVVNCETQDELDYYWDKLLAGGKPQQCGWLTDKYGVPWQIVPTILAELLTAEDPAKAQRVMAAILKMIKLDVATLKQAYDGR